MRGGIRNVMGVLLIGIIGFTPINWSNAFLLSRDLPCDFLDSINITNGILQKNDKSILFNDMKFTQDHYATINYVIENGTTRVSAKPYIRGCICDNRPCIRLCCPYGKFLDSRIKEGSKCRSHDAAKRFEVEILDANNKLQNITLDDHFAFVDDKPCNNIYKADKYNITHVMN